VDAEGAKVMSQDGAGEASDVSAARPVQIGLYLTNQHPLGSDMVQALGARSGCCTMPMTQPVPFLARLAAEAGEMHIRFYEPAAGR
jgi:hypothetical protein